MGSKCGRFCIPGIYWYWNSLVRGLHLLKWRCKQHKFRLRICVRCYMCKLVKKSTTDGYIGRLVLDHLEHLLSTSLKYYSSCKRRLKQAQKTTAWICAPTLSVLTIRNRMFSRWNKTGYLLAYIHHVHGTSDDREQGSAGRQFSLLEGEVHLYLHKPNLRWTGNITSSRTFWLII
jgi:hypothetical protein